MHKLNLGVDDFLKSGFDLRMHLCEFLKLSSKDLEEKLPRGMETLANIHPGSLKPENAKDFYEKSVGDAHLIDLASWHLNSCEYIADTLRLQEMFAGGQVLDFGGGIGTHSLALAALKTVDHVWFVDLNPLHREFVEVRAAALGLEGNISVHRSLEETDDISFDTLVCLDVLEHLPNPSEQLCIFNERMNDDSVALLNWYFYKGQRGEFPFHFDDPKMINEFFLTLQDRFIEIFHPYLITTRAYKSRN